jgi:hypothetical protein
MALGGCARGEIAVQIARRCSLAAIRTGGKVRSQRLWKARGKLGPHRGPFRMRRAFEPLSIREISLHERCGQ